MKYLCIAALTALTGCAMGTSGFGAVYPAYYQAEAYQQPSYAAPRPAQVCRPLYRMNNGPVYTCVGG